jgi:tetratricopeptide (TPR) repeat protein
MLDFDELYKQGVALVWPYLFLANRESKDPSSLQGQEDLTQGINYLQRALSLNRNNWSALWLIGKAYEAVGNRTAFYDSLREAFHINPTHIDVSREYMQSCLKSGRTSEAVTIARHTLSLKPVNHGLVANLALALLLDGQIQESIIVIRQAASMVPNDPITQSLQHVIEDVAAGKRAVPQNMI